MMTIMTSFIGLLPLLFGAGQTGKEILYPLALVDFEACPDFIDTVSR